MAGRLRLQCGLLQAGWKPGQQQCSWLMWNHISTAVRRGYLWCLLVSCKLAQYAARQLCHDVSPDVRLLLCRHQRVIGAEASRHRAAATLEVTEGESDARRSQTSRAPGDLYMDCRRNAGQQHAFRVTPMQLPLRPLSTML